MAIHTVSYIVKLLLSNVPLFLILCNDLVTLKRVCVSVKSTCILSKYCIDRADAG